MTIINYTLPLKQLIMLFLLISMIIHTEKLHSQSENSHPVKRELGLRFSGFNDFNLMYKKSKSDNIYRRHRFLISSFLFSTRDNSFSSNIGYAFGKETRRSIKDDFGWYIGPEYRFSILYNSREINESDRSRQVTIQPSLGLVIGFYLDISDRIILSAEVIPAITAGYTGFTDADDTLMIDATLSTNATALTLMYQF